MLSVWRPCRLHPPLELDAMAKLPAGEQADLIDRAAAGA
jgi:hypothetical protein